MKKITKIVNVEAIDKVPFPILNIKFKDNVFTTDYDDEVFTIENFKKKLWRVVFDLVIYDGEYFAISVNNRRYSNTNLNFMYLAIVEELTEKYLDRKLRVTLRESEIKALLDHRINSSTDKAYRSAIKELKEYL